MMRFCPKYKRFAAPIGLFVVVYVLHLISGVIASGDSRWCVHTAESILCEGNTDLDEYPQDLEDNDYYWIERVDGHYYTRFPIGASLVALPFVFVLDHAVRASLVIFPKAGPYIIQHCPKPITQVTVTSLYWCAELIIACFVVALASVFIFLTARETLKTRSALLVTFVFAFCTSAWSTGSRSMGQHGPSMLFLGITLYLFVLARRRPSLVQYASLPLAFSYVVRPTNSIPILFLTVCVLIQHRRYFLQYLLWSLPVAVPFLVFNFHIYHAPLSDYYRPQQLGTTHHFFEALAGTLISPGRGLFIFTPVVALAGAGFALKIKSKELCAFDVCLVAVLALHWIAIASFGDWWGGHSYGPRYFTDLMPFFVYFMIPVAGYFAAQGVNAPSAPRWGVALLVAVSFFIHARGATDLRTWVWNREPTDVNVAPNRLWDWRDPQFLRDLFVPTPGRTWTWTRK